MQVASVASDMIPEDIHYLPATSKPEVNKPSSFCIHFFIPGSLPFVIHLVTIVFPLASSSH